MGLGKFLGKVGDILGGVAPIVGLVNPALGIGAATVSGSLSQFRGPAVPFSPPMASVPSMQTQQFFGDPSFFPLLPGFVQPAEAAVPAIAAAGAGGVLFGLTRTLALTISKLAARLGISVLGLAGLGRVGSRIWRSLTVFARRHPNISLISMLTALGLTVEEASEYIAWGSTRRRRRRGGISGRDMRVAKRTIRRISSFQHDLAHLRAHAGGFRRGASRRGGGVSVVRAG